MGEILENLTIGLAVGAIAYFVLVGRKSFGSKENQNSTQKGYPSNQEIIIEESAPLNPEIVKRLAVDFDKSTRSIISKARSLQVEYQKGAGSYTSGISERDLVADWNVDTGPGSWWWSKHKLDRDLFEVFLNEVNKSFSDVKSNEEIVIKEYKYWLKKTGYSQNLK